MNPIVEKALKLEQEAKNARTEAIHALQNDRRTIEEQLKALGAGTEPLKVKKAPDLSKKCKVCGDPTHDGRFHRSEKHSSPPAPPKSQSPPLK